MWVKFLADFRWKPNPSSAKVWPAGWAGDVPQAAADAAIAAGKAEESEPADKPAVKRGKPGTGKNGEQAAKEE